MSHDADILTLPLASIAQRCQQESARFFQQASNDPRFCYEVFRRAIVQHMGNAWTLIYTQYAPLVSSWVEHHVNFAVSGEEAGYFVNRAFEKMWSALSPDKFANFPDLKSLLRYLQLCTHSVIIDHTRVRAHRRLATSLSTSDPEDHSDSYGDAGIEEDILDELERQQFWQRIQQRLKSEEEHRLLYYRFAFDLMPREICARFPEEFPDVKEVYKMLQKILDRLGRDSELKNFLDPDD
jgi:DNA-directed RNA polymerase specialized sigma24 family protein